MRGLCEVTSCESVCLERKTWKKKGLVSLSVQLMLSKRKRQVQTMTNKAAHSRSQIHTLRQQRKARTSSYCWLDQGRKVMSVTLLLNTHHWELKSSLSAACWRENSWAGKRQALSEQPDSRTLIHCMSSCPATPLCPVVKGVLECTFNFYSWLTLIFKNFL